MDRNKIDISGNAILKTVLLIGSLWIVLKFGSTFILPLLLSIIIATLLDRPTTKFQEWGLPKWLSITVSMVLMAAVVFLVFWLVGSQVNNMADDWPTIENKASEKYAVFKDWAQRTLQINPESFASENFDLIGALKGLFTGFLSSLTGLMSQSFIILVYVILLLVQKEVFVNFVKKLFKKERPATEFLKESSSVISNYLFGKGKIMVFLFVIYFIGFKIGKVPYALFLAVFAALFSIIPYVGNIIGGGIAVLLSYLYAGIAPALIVIGVISLAQVVENYLLTPWIIGDELDLNPFITIVGVILFSMLWGIVGAVIALPLVGILKAFFKQVRGMEPYVYLLEKH